MNFSEFLKKSADEIDTEIEAFFATWSKEIIQISPRLLPLITALQNACADGKRIRGSLVLLGYTLAKGESAAQKKDVLQAAIAYEIFQTAILAHDDIIDKSPTRRGKPALYKALGGDHYGLSQAMCLGDIGFFLAYRILSESHFPDREKNAALQFFSKAMHDTGVGELLDVTLSQKNVEATEQEVLEVSRLKTAYYTFVGPLFLGATLGNAADHTFVALKQYGENIGSAFQIQDDIRDVFGTEATLKKEIGGDIKEGKNTILIVKAKEKADTRQGEVLNKYYGNSNIGKDEIEAIKQVFTETGALQYAEDKAKSFSAQAGDSIPQITVDTNMQQLLHEIINFVMR